MENNIFLTQAYDVLIIFVSNKTKFHSQNADIVIQEYILFKESIQRKFELIRYNISISRKSQTQYQYTPNPDNLYNNGSMPILSPRVCGIIISTSLPSISSSRTDTVLLILRSCLGAVCLALRRLAVVGGVVDGSLLALRLTRCLAVLLRGRSGTRLVTVLEGAVAGCEKHDCCLWVKRDVVGSGKFGSRLNVFDFGFGFEDVADE